MLLGADGAARAVLAELVKEGVSDIMVVVRDLERGRQWLKICP